MVTANEINLLTNNENNYYQDQERKEFFSNSDETVLSLHRSQLSKFFSIQKRRRWRHYWRGVNRNRFHFILLLLTIVLIVIEEHRYAIILNIYGNFYWSEVPLNDAIKDCCRIRTISLPIEKRLNISIIVIIDAKSSHNHSLREYDFAQATLRCYAQLHGYPLHLIELPNSIDNYTTSLNGDYFNDFLFLRHNAVIEWLKRYPDVEWLLFLDADIGVINPSHLLEDYIKDVALNEKSLSTFDLIFYERLFSREVMAGSYFVRNTEFSQQFLSHWSNYNKKLPNSFHGADNSALHAVFMDFFASDSTKAYAIKRSHCEQIWNKSQSWSDVIHFVQCSQKVLGGENRTTFETKNLLKTNGKVYLVRGWNHRKRWARDGWLTANKWSFSDFMFHGWKQSLQNAPFNVFAQWNSPLVIGKNDNNKQSPSLCSSINLASQVWRYKNTFLAGDEKIKWMAITTAKHWHSIFEKNYKN